jgi:hypothetical protein
MSTHTNAHTAAEQTARAATKRCCRCRRRRSVTRFAYRDRAAGTLQSRCRDCQAEASAEHYAANRDRVKARTAQRNAQVREHHLEVLDAARAAARCADCGAAHSATTQISFTRPDGGPRPGDVARAACSDAALQAALEASTPLCPACMGRRRAAAHRVDTAVLAGGPRSGMRLGDAIVAAALQRDQPSSFTELAAAVRAAGIVAADTVLRTTITRELADGRLVRVRRGHYSATVNTEGSSPTPVR